MKTKTLIALVGLTLAAPAAGYAAGTTAALFLRQETSARSSAMGGAAAALYEDTGGTYLNPAGLGFMEQNQLSLSAWKGLDGTSKEAFLSGVLKAGGAGVFSLSYLGNNTGDEEVFDLGGNSSKVTLASEYAAGAGWGHKIGENFAIGGQAKYVKSELVEAYTAKTLAFDAGALLRTADGRFSAGAGFQNAGGTLKYYSENEDLPMALYAGGAMRLKSGIGKFTAAADVRKVKGQDSPDLRVGLEYGASIAVLRVGGKNVAGEKSLTLGGGFHFDWVGFDYSFEPAGDRLNQQTHKFTINLLFGGQKENKAMSAAPSESAVAAAGI